MSQPRRVRRPSTESRLRKLEADSHPPVAFVECSECHAVVFEESFGNHRIWHNRIEDAS